MFLDQYKLAVDLGNFEVEHGRTRFYENAKLQLAIAAGSLGLASYGLRQTDYRVTIACLAFLVALLGSVTAVFWTRQIKRGSLWETNWRRLATEMERTRVFQRAIEAEEAWPLWSDKKTQDLLGKLEPGRSGATLGFYRQVAWSFVVFHSVSAVLILGIVAYWSCEALTTLLASR